MASACSFHFTSKSLSLTFDTRISIHFNWSTSILKVFVKPQEYRPIIVDVMGRKGQLSTDNEDGMMYEGFFTEADANRSLESFPFGHVRPPAGKNCAMSIFNFRVYVRAYQTKWTKVIFQTDPYEDEIERD